MRLLALFLVAVLSAPAQTITIPKFVIDTEEFAPGYSHPDPIFVHELGAVVLKTPGTYTAASWSISGDLRLGAPGNYTLVATTGSILFNRAARLRRVENTNVGYAITFRHAGDFNFATAGVDPSITITQGVVPVLDAPPLVNLSTLVTLAPGQTHTSGFVVGGRLQRRVLVRAIGPTLGAFGVANPLMTPALTVFLGQFPMRNNTGWAGDEELAATFPKVGAFNLPAGSRDAATIVTLNPGSYTVQVTGGAGAVLLEIYYLD